MLLRNLKKMLIVDQSSGEGGLEGVLGGLEGVLGGREGVLGNYLFFLILFICSFVICWCIGSNGCVLHPFKLHPFFGLQHANETL